MCIRDRYDTLHDAKQQLQGEDYSRFVLSLRLPVEGEETYEMCIRDSIYPDIMLHAEDAANGVGGLLYYFYKLHSG